MHGRRTAPRDSRSNTSQAAVTQRHRRPAGARPRRRTLLCGDLFTQGGEGHPALTESDILGPSEAFRGPMDYFAHAANTRPLLERLAAADVLDGERKRKVM